MKIGQPHRPVEIMPSKMEVASQHCDTVQNKTKDILDTVKKDFFIHDSRARHPVQSCVCGTLRTFIFSLGQLRSIERFRTLKDKCRMDWMGLDGMDWLSYTAVTPRASLQSDAINIESISFLDNSYGFNNLWLLLHVVQVTFFTIPFPPQTISAV